jgi:hypothetical protein
VISLRRDALFADRRLVQNAGVLHSVQSDATTRHLEEIAADVIGLLGPGIDLIELALDTDGPDIVLRATYEMADTTIESVGRGGSAIEAHSRLRDAIISDRIGLGLRVLT